MTAKTDRTTCKWGHPWIAENLTENSAGITVCKACLKRYTQESIARKKARLGRLHVQTHCANGHEFTPDNTRVIRCNKKDGSTSSFQQCLKCLAARHALLAARKAALPPKRPRGGKPLLQRCKKKGHPLKGDNLVERIDERTGKKTRMCRACRNEYMKEREYLKRRGLKPPPIRIDYPSLDAKIAALTKITDGCHIWTGTLSGPADAKAPVVALKNERASVRPWLCERAGRSIPPKHRCVMKEGCDKMCVREDHIEILSGRQRFARFQTAEVRERAKQTMRVRYGTGREDYMRDIFSHREAIERAVARKISARLRHVLDDVVQDAMLAAYQQWLVDHDSIDNLKSFLISTALNRAVDLSRLAWSRKIVPISNFLAPGAYEEEEDYLEANFAAPPEYNDPYLLLQRAEVERMRMRILKERMRTIPPKARQCLLMKLDECSQQEIAQKLHIAENTVEQHLRKAYMILRGPEKPMWNRRGYRDSYFLEAIVA